MELDFDSSVSRTYIKARYYKTQNKTASKQKLTVLMKVKKLLAVITFVFVYVVPVYMGYLLFRLGIVCKYKAYSFTRHRAYGKGIPSKMVSHKGLFAYSSVCNFNGTFVQCANALLLVIIYSVAEAVLGASFNHTGKMIFGVFERLEDCIYGID